MGGFLIPVKRPYVRESVCCLLVLNLVSSTLPCIRQPGPRLSTVITGQTEGLKVGCGMGVRYVRYGWIGGFAKVDNRLGHEKWIQGGVTGVFDL